MTKDVQCTILKGKPLTLSCVKTRESHVQAVKAHQQLMTKVATLKAAIEQVTA